MSKIEVYYNSACPVCDAGVREQKRAMEKPGAGEAVWTDMTCAPDALAADGLTLDDVRRHFYARDSEGALHRGADAAALMWRETPGRRWLGRLVASRAGRPAARFVYDRFADVLYAWNRRRGRW